jgi:2-polyprenyl-6-methoxyphenol hydroxylase-like FAD-dependent oxidoreductase
VIVGARCAGSPLAQRLAEAGWDVVIVDRSPPPADTVSTHLFFPNTLARLAQLGALQRLEAERTLHPLIHRIRILDEEFSGTFTPIGGFNRACGVTRPVLDKALLDSAVDAGAKTLFGRRVTGLIGEGTEVNPVRGVVMEDGEAIGARWVLGADGRASTVASLLGLEKQRPMAGGLSLLYGYFTGLPDNEFIHLDAHEDLILNWGKCEDDVHIIVLNGPPELTHGNAEERRRRLREGMARFPETLDGTAARDAELISEVRVAPETMLRGFFRQAAGPGWALVGDAGHFKHPATAQGISDAIEQALHVADALLGGEDLSEYGQWRDERATEHYEWSFDFARLPRPEVAGPLFRGIAGDPEAAQDFRDTNTRFVRPRSGAMTEERMNRWFSAA